MGFEIWLRLGPRENGQGLRQSVSEPSIHSHLSIATTRLENRKERHHINFTRSTNLTNQYNGSDFFKQFIAFEMTTHIHKKPKPSAPRIIKPPVPSMYDCAFSFSSSISSHHRHSLGRPQLLVSWYVRISQIYLQW